MKRRHATADEQQAQDVPQTGGSDGHGRSAERPRDIPRRGWWDILKRVKAEMKEDNLTLIAAGVAFYATLALFPALIALVTVYGLLFNADDVQRQLESLSGTVPPDVISLLEEQMGRAASASEGGLTLGLIASLLGVLWSASGGMQNLITGLNLVYDEPEGRGFVKLRSLALFLTLGALIAVVVALALVAAFPAVMNAVGLGTFAAIGANAVRWVLLALLVGVGLAVLYRWAPDRDNPQWRWVSWGAVLAVVLWIITSALFSFYVSNFGSYNKTYGAIAAVIVLMFWLWISCLVVLLGAEVDAEIERQTAKDTTTGPQKPMGERRAVAADTVGRGSDTD
jgi:membrane protein